MYAREIQRDRNTFVSLLRICERNTLDEVMLSHVYSETRMCVCVRARACVTPLTFDFAVLPAQIEFDTNRSPNMPLTDHSVRLRASDL